MLIACLALSPGNAEAAEPVTVAVLPIKLLDTSAEPTDQSADHGRRLAAMTDALADDLPRAGRYRTIRLEGQGIRERCPDGRAECLLGAARDAGARLVFVGVVHKSSTLIMQMWARLVDVRTGRDVLTRDLNFRGDNDESWHRAEAFLTRQIEAAPTPP